MSLKNGMFSFSGSCKDGKCGEVLIAGQYKECLHVVSITSDSEERWKNFSASKGLKGNNFNDLQGTHGICAKYGVRGVPYYVFISPEGKILTTWGGYGKGSLKAKLEGLLKK